jgi:hypothetical protein
VRPLAEWMVGETEKEKQQDAKGGNNAKNATKNKDNNAVNNNTNSASNTNNETYASKLMNNNNKNNNNNNNKNNNNKNNKNNTNNTNNNVSNHNNAPSNNTVNDPSDATIKTTPSSPPKSNNVDSLSAESKCDTAVENKQGVCTSNHEKDSDDDDSPAATTTSFKSKKAYMLVYTRRPAEKVREKAVNECSAETRNEKASILSAELLHLQQKQQQDQAFEFNSLPTQLREEVEAHNRAVIASQEERQAEHVHRHELRKVQTERVEEVLKCIAPPSKVLSCFLFFFVLFFCSYFLSLFSFLGLLLDCERSFALIHHWQACCSD